MGGLLGVNASVVPNHRAASRASAATMAYLVPAFRARSSVFRPISLGQPASASRCVVSPSPPEAGTAKLLKSTSSIANPVRTRLAMVARAVWVRRVHDARCVERPGLTSTLDDRDTRPACRILFAVARLFTSLAARMYGRTGCDEGGRDWRDDARACELAAGAERRSIPDRSWHRARDRHRGGCG